MAAARSDDDANYGAIGKDASLMALMEMFPNLSMRQIRMHVELFPADVPFELLVDSLIDVGPDGGTPPEEEFEEAAKEDLQDIAVDLQDVAANDLQDNIEPLIEFKVCVGAFQNEPQGDVSSARASVRALPKRRSGNLQRPRFLTYKQEVKFRPRSWKKERDVPKKPDLEDSEEEFTDAEEMLSSGPEELENSLVELEVPKKHSPEVVCLSDSSASPGTPLPAPVPTTEEVLLRLADVFPEAPLEELAALCEGHPGHSLEQLVAEFLLLQEAKEAAELPDASLNLGDFENAEFDNGELEVRESEDLNAVNDGAVADVLAGDEIPDEPEDLEMIERYQDLLTMFPTADPDFLRERATELTAATMQAFVAQTLETGAYPKEDEYRARERVRRLMTKYVDRFDAAAFLATFPDPAGHFASRRAVVSAVRTEKAVAYLALRYGSRTPQDLAALLAQNEGNLSRACAEAGAGKSTTGWLDLFVDHEDMLQEIAFIEHREELELVRRRIAESKQVAVIAAQCKKETLTCGCCFGDSFLLIDMASCIDGHLFCKECIARSAEVLIGQGKTEFPCLEDCGKQFSERTLKSLLKRPVFLRMEQRRQFEEVHAAKILDLETCPACDFSAIPRPDDIVFTCLNPDCQLVTCRKCREPGHIPLRCDELPEKEQHTQIRTQLEDRMTQALVRECWNCKKKFVKSDGCNKMQCTCGALMCYLCRQPVKDYSHFNGPGGDAFSKCELFSNNEKLHVDAVREAALKARAEVAAANPNLELKYDPTLLLP